MKAINNNEAHKREEHTATNKPPTTPRCWKLENEACSMQHLDDEWRKNNWNN